MGASNRDVAAATVPGAAPETATDLRDRIEILGAFMGGIVFELDRHGRYLGVTTGDPRLLARPMNELLGRTVTEVLGVPGAQLEGVIGDVIDKGEPASFEYTIDVPAGRRTFQCETRPHDPRGGGERRILALVRDVTDAKALEAKLVQAERLAALGLLAASVGHEIRQPLAYLLTSVDVLERDLGAAAVAHGRSLGDIRNGAKRIAEIAASLELLAAPRRTPAELDIRRPLQSALDLCATELGRVRVETAFADVPAILGDEGELCQVFANLLLNAAQALSGRSPGAGTIHLATRVADDGNTLEISVADDGPGMSPETMAHVFDAFFTTKSDHGGIGLGLFITRTIVEAHGGTLEVSSAVGRGATFIVSLPLANASRMPADEPTTGTRPVLAPLTSVIVPCRRRLQILVLDDEPRFLESLRLALEDEHHIETQTSAADALARLEDDPRRFDVVLCDLSMPEMDGAAFYERMRELGVADRFVLMTGGAFTARGSEFVRQRVCRSIAKPFLLEKLLTLLDDVTRDSDVS